MDDHEGRDPFTPNELAKVTTTLDDASAKAVTQTANPSDMSKTLGSKTAAGPEPSNGEAVQPEAAPPGEPETGKERRVRQKKVAYRKKEKEQRKNLKGWMDGKGMAGTRTKDARVERLYHHHFPYPMRDHEEPDVLTPFNPHDTPINNDDGLSDEDLAAKHEHIKHD
ncbi:hypothetical protein BDZ89DRAFT_1144585 [Hymenopellis radicata]|nr:hypothetical protein BDZ89DRAFT_1144585 [Hymenopellis radicata]